ncbi:MAG: prepilin-type N-terminal cleavage/methylation domain-containing protein [Mariprofundaceae bacterium]
MTKQQGFTLIELVVSVLVASVVMLAMGNMLITDIRSNQTSEHRIDAAAVAQSVLANISARTATAGYLQATAQAAAVAQLVNKPWFTPTITLNPTPTVAAGAVTVTVQLAWNEHGINKNVTLTTQVVVP